jgi:hypothetical protein
MPARLRSPGQVQADRAKISNMYLRGFSLMTIANEMGVSRENVAYEMGKIRKEWRASAVFDFALARQQELARIDLIEQEAWRAWENSKAPIEATSTRQRRRDLKFPMAVPRPGEEAELPVDSVSEANKRSTMRDPNAGFLDRIAWCVEMRCKILGLVAPQELRHTGTIQQIHEIFYEPAALPDNGQANRLVILGGAPASLPAPTAPPAAPEERPDEATPTANGRVYAEDDEELDDDDEAE